jgi:hypothetical protein
MVSPCYKKGYEIRDVNETFLFLNQKKRIKAMEK